MLILSEKTKSNLLISWRFYLANCLIFWLIGLLYIQTTDWPLAGQIGINGVILVLLQVFTTFISHLALLAFIPCFLLPLILQIILRKPRFFIPVNALLGMFSVILLLADGLLFVHYRFHLNGFFLNLFFSKSADQFFDFSSMEWSLFIIMFVGLFIVELCIMRFITKTLYLLRNFKYRSLIITLLIGTLLLSWITLLLSAASSENKPKLLLRNHLILTKMQLFPLYEEVVSALLPSEYSLAKLVNLEDGFYEEPETASFPLHYPRKPLQTSNAQQHYNIIIIGVDALRPDMINQKIMPTVTAFSRDNLFFKNHASGGNSTRAGLFSLFYSIPSPYWTAMLKQHRAPLLLDALQERGYHLGIFVSAALTPEGFQKTLFLNVKNLPLKTPGNTPRIRDDRINQEAIRFINKNAKTSKPFFSFIFYNSLHSYCYNNHIPMHFKPQITHCDRFMMTNDTDPTPYFNRYKNAAYYIDHLIDQLLKTLQKNNLMNDTVIIITGDHGEEFNDSHTNSWGHAGNFTRFQIDTPLIIHWPGKKAQVINYPTSHYDIVPTLMKKVLGYQNPISDYSIGKSLFNPKNKPFLIAGSYIDYGIITSNTITTIDPTGNIFISDELNRPIENEKPDPRLLQSAWKILRQFY